MPVAYRCVCFSCWCISVAGRYLPCEDQWFGDQEVCKGIGRGKIINSFERHVVSGSSDKGSLQIREGNSFIL